MMVILTNYCKNGKIGKKNRSIRRFFDRPSAKIFSGMKIGLDGIEGFYAASRWIEVIIRLENILDRLNRSTQFKSRKLRFYNSLSRTKRRM